MAEVACPVDPPVVVTAGDDDDAAESGAGVGDGEKVLADVSVPDCAFSGDEGTPVDTFPAPPDGEGGSSKRGDEGGGDQLSASETAIFEVTSTREIPVHRERQRETKKGVR